MSRVVVLGIDGLDWDLLNQWKEELPTFRRLIEEGSGNRMESVIPTLSCPAWPCMFTGLEPSGLNMYDFIDLTNGRLFTSEDWWEKSLFYRFDRDGIKQVLINLAFSYPPHKLLNGILSCGLGTPIVKSTYTYPKAFEKELEDSNLLVDISVRGRERSNRDMLSDMLRREYLNILQTLTTKPFDLFFGTFFTLDYIQHYYWKDMIGGDSSYEGMIKENYQYIDSLIGNLLSLVEDSTIIIVSDHGQGPHTKGFNINRWLEKKGFLKFKHDLREGFWSKVVKGVAKTSIGHRLGQLVVPIIPERIWRGASEGGRLKNLTADLYSTIDWNNTVAYSPSQSSGCIFVKDGLMIREYLGIDRIASNIKDIKEGLRQIGLECKETNWRKDFREARCGGHLRVLPTNGIYPMNTWSKEIWQDHSWSGSHTLNGVFLSNNKDLRCEGIPSVAPLIERLVKE